MGKRKRESFEVGSVVDDKSVAAAASYSGATDNSSSQLVSSISVWSQLERCWRAVSCTGGRRAGEAARADGRGRLRAARSAGRHAVCELHRLAARQRRRVRPQRGAVRLPTGRPPGDQRLGDRPHRVRMKYGSGKPPLIPFQSATLFAQRPLSPRNSSAQTYRFLKQNS